MNKKRKSAKKKQRVRGRKLKRLHGNPEHKPIDIFRDGFETVRRGDLPSGGHSDPRMNLSLKDIDPCEMKWDGPKQGLPLAFSQFGKASQ